MSYPDQSRQGGLLAAVLLVGAARAAAPERPILNIDLSRNGSEVAASVPSIAQDPAHPQRIAVAWRFIATTDERTAQAQGWVCHLSISTDGGEHFSDEVLDWHLPDTTRCNAPYVDFGAHGALYSGATLTAPVPPGVTNEIRPFGRAVIRKSTDGGKSWSATVDVIGTDTRARFAPNPSVPEEAMSIPWDGARGVVDRDIGDVFVSGGYPAPPGGADHSQRFYSRSTDGGLTWGPIRAYGSTDWPQRWDSHIIAAHGELALSYIGGAVPGPPQSCPCVVFATSSDGGASLQRRLVTPVKSLDTLVHYPPLAADPMHRGVFALALVSDDTTDIDVLVSTDNGVSWQRIVLPRVSDVVMVSRPALTYAPRGTLIAMWRGYHADQSFDIYMTSVSGQTRTPIRVTSSSSHVPERLLSHYAVRGDFINVATADERFVHAAWTDWRTGSEARVYYGRVPLESLLVAIR